MLTYSGECDAGVAQRGSVSAGSRDMHRQSAHIFPVTLVSDSLVGCAVYFAMFMPAACWKLNGMLFSFQAVFIISTYKKCCVTDRHSKTFFSFYRSSTPENCSSIFLNFKKKKKKRSCSRALTQLADSRLSAIVRVVGERPCPLLLKCVWILVALVCGFLADWTLSRARLRAKSLSSVKQISKWEEKPSKNDYRLSLPDGVKSYYAYEFDGHRLRSLRCVQVQDFVRDTGNTHPSSPLDIGILFTTPFSCLLWSFLFSMVSFFLTSFMSDIM